MTTFTNVTEHEQGTMRLFAARTGAIDIVTIEGSVLGGENMLPKDKEAVPNLTAELLDAGTTRADKDAIRAALAARGASISFRGGAERLYFSATCLPDDLDFTLALIAECLGDAVFPPAELALQKKRTLAEIEETKTDTNATALRAFGRMVYDPGHVNYPSLPEESRAHVEAVRGADLHAFRKRLGTGGLVLAIVGDVAPEKALARAERAFAALGAGTTEPSLKRANKAQPKTKESKTVIKDKANIDVYLGGRIPLTYDSPGFLPFAVMVDMLGGRGLSSGHLMRTIRERDGLTYGIYASPAGFADGADGALRIWATFSPPTYERAIAQTLKELEVFRTKGLTEKALTAKKSQMQGRYVVGLATSGGLAGTLHRIGVEGKPLSYLDEYPRLIASVNVADLKDAAALVPWDNLSIAAAGTFPA